MFIASLLWQLVLDGERTAKEGGESTGNSKIQMTLYAFIVNSSVFQQANLMLRIFAVHDGYLTSSTVLKLVQLVSEHKLEKVC